MSNPEQEFSLPVSFDTTIPGGVGPEGPHKYDLSLPHLKLAMIQKIEKNIAQFGSADKFLEVFQRELSEKFDVAENAVRVYHMRRIQMEFVKEWMRENSTSKDAALDGPEVSSAQP